MTACCTSCRGTGIGGDAETNGMCRDCYGTGCAHPEPCTDRYEADLGRRYAERMSEKRVLTAADEKVIHDLLHGNDEGEAGVLGSH